MNFRDTGKTVKIMPGKIHRCISGAEFSLKHFYLTFDPHFAMEIIKKLYVSYYRSLFYSLGEIIRRK